MTTWRLLLALGLCACFVPGVARADDSDAARVRAAEHFDAGVRAFQANAFAEAAREFLSADQSAANGVALRNALSAARRADAPLLLWHAATRLLALPDVSAEERVTAESARAEAEARTAVLELRCEPRDCEPLLDGEAAQPGDVRVLPGTHHVTWNTFAVDVTCEAAQRCLATFAVEPAPPAVVATPARDDAEQPVPPPQKTRKQRAALGTFIGLGASALLFGGLTVWSGLEALDARDLHERRPSAYDPEDVRRLARRSDLFLGTSLLLAAGAAATALWWVDWNPRQRTQLVVLPEGGAAIRSIGRF